MKTLEAAYSAECFIERFNRLFREDILDAYVFEDLESD